MQKRLLFTAGGTGGHIYPALAVAKQIQKSHPRVEILFVGGHLHTNYYFKAQDFKYNVINCSPVGLKKPLKLAKNALNIGLGLIQSRQILKKFQPQLIIGFGSYHTFPLLLAAKLGRYPYILHEANCILGKVNRLMTSSALVTATYFPLINQLKKGKIVSGRDAIERRIKERLHYKKRSMCLL